MRRFTAFAAATAAFVCLGLAGAGCGPKDRSADTKGGAEKARAAAESLEAAGQMIPALESFREASRRFPMEGWAWEGLGRTARRLGRENEATEGFRTAVLRDPGRALAHHQLAEIALDEGRLDEALREIDDAIRLTGDLPELLALRVRILSAGGHTIDARSTLSRAEAIAGGDVAVKAARVYAFSAADSLAIALDEAEELVRDSPDDARAREARAFVREQVGDVAGAAEDYAQILRVDPHRPGARESFARLLLGSNELGLAEETFREILAEDPTDSRALEGLGATALARGDPEAAEKSFRGAVDADPESASAYLALGKFLVSRHRLEEGIETLRKARARASLDPRMWEACGVALAEAHLTFGEPQNALEVAESILARSEESKPARAVRARALAAGAGGEESGAMLERAAARPTAGTGEVIAYADWLLARGDAGRAIASLDALVERDSTDIAAQAKQAEVLSALGRTAEAKAAWNRILERDPESPDALLGLARLQLDEGHAAEAADLARRAGRLAPRDARPETLEGEALLRLGLLAEADSSLARAQTKDPRSWRAALLRGNVLERTNRPQEAARSYDAILERNEQLPEVHAALAWVLADREIDAARAEQHARRALELAPEDVGALCALAWAELRLSRPKDALATIDEAKRESPRNARVYYVRGVILQSMGRRLDARGELRRVLDLDPKFERAEEVRSRIEELK